MSIFSSIRKSRQSAKEHNAKVAEQKKKESEITAYRHVPTHAAADAIASAPPSWREADRAKIVEANRRRSAMTATAQQLSMPAIPPVGSSLSYVSYPGNTSETRLPRAFSYSGMPPSSYGNRDVVYSVPDVPSLDRSQWKGKEVVREHGFEARRNSPPSNKGDVSPVGSSQGSTASQDGLEMKFTPLEQSQAAGPAPKMHRLAPRNQRRNSAGSMDGPSSAPYVSSSRDSRPPPSIRGFSAIPPSAMSGPPLPGSLPGHWNNRSGGNGWRGSSSSLHGSSSQPTSPLATNAPASASSAFDGLEFPFQTSRPASQQAERPPSARAAESSKPSLAIDPKEKRAVKSKFMEMGSPEMDAEKQDYGYTHQSMDASRDSTPRQFTDVFPEPPKSTVAAAPGQTKGRKLTKGGSKLVKKNRWSGSKGNAIAA